jgi:CubicO group peptidase (beta-lactamase class C family)
MKIDRLLGEAVERGAVAGLVAAAVTREGVVYTGAFGRLRRGEPAPVPPGAVFWIASMTKLLTSLAAMQLVERGALSLDEPIGAIVPELGRRAVLEGFDPSGTPRLRPARRPIALKHLLTHTSGFAEDVWHPDIARYVRHAGIPPSSTRRRSTLDLPLLFEPGERWQYGISHEWVGQAIERASGQPLEAYVQDHVLGPLGMSDTAWRPRQAWRGRQAAVHRRGADGRLTPFDRALPAEPEFTPGGGGLHSTARDYAALIAMVLNDGLAGGVRLIGADTLALMRGNHTGDIAVGKLEATSPEHANPVEFMAGLRRCWGLGFQVNLEPLPTGRSAGSLSWGGQGNTYYWIDPARGVGGVLLTQVLPFADPAVLDLFARFEAAVYAEIVG